MAATQTMQATRLAMALVEDDADVALLVGDIMGAGVAHFSDGASAVEALTSSTTQPRLVLLDLELPKMDGLEVLRRLRAHPATRRTPVVVFTGTDVDPDMGYRMGANGWVRKPRDADELARAVQAIQSYWMDWNRPSDD